MLRNKLFFTALLLVSTLSGIAASGQQSGDSRQIDVSSFHSISNRTRADLSINMNEEQSVIAHGESSELDKLRIYVRNGKLIIRRKWPFVPLSRDAEINIRISMEGRELRRLHLSSSGDALVTGGLNCQKSELSTSARGSIIAGGDVEYLELRSTASGNVSFKGTSREMSLSTSSSGDLFVEGQTMKMKCRISSSGKIDFTGASVETEIRISSRGNFDGMDFITETADISISGSGDAELTVLKKMNGRLSSSGSVRYKGEPIMGDLNTSGRGEFINNN